MIWNEDKNDTILLFIRVRISFVCYRMITQRNVFVQVTKEEKAHTSDELEKRRNAGIKHSPFLFRL